MPQSLVTVRRSNGAPVSGARVVLSFAAGHTDASHTDSEGRALVHHASQGDAIVFVNGREARRMHAPDSVDVTI